MAATVNATVVSCSPPPVCHALNWSTNLHDSTGAGNDHLYVNANICVDSIGNVTSSTGSNSSTTYGFLNFFGDVVTAHPLGAGGSTGTNVGADIKGWVNDTQYTFTARWDVHVGYTIGGVGLAGDNGVCTATWPLRVVSGGGSVDSQVFPNLAKVRSSCQHGFYLSYAT